MDDAHLRKGVRSKELQHSVPHSSQRIFKRNSRKSSIFLKSVYLTTLCQLNTVTALSDKAEDG